MRLIFVAEIQSPGFEADLKLDDRTPELTGMLLLELLQRSKVVWGTVSKFQEHAGETVQ